MKNFYFINEQRGGNETPPPTPSPKPKPTPKKPSIVYTQVDIKENEICDGSKEVTKGMKGDIVGYIQIALDMVPEGKDPDYKFGKDTEKAVVNYQLKHKDKGLTVTGKVDKNTFNLLFKGTVMACTKEENKNTTDMNKKLNQDTKTDTQKDNPKVGPQIKDTPKFIPQIKRVKWIGEQVAVKQEDPKVKFLKQSLRTKDKQGLSCLDRYAKIYKLKEHPDYGNSIVTLQNDNPAIVYLSINPTNQQEENFFVVSDGTKLTGIYQSGIQRDIECSDQMDLDPNENLSPKQLSFVNYNVTDTSGYKKTIDPGKEEYYDKFDIVNVFKGASEYFAPNTYFVYKRKGYKVEERGEEFYNQIESVLNKLQWTYKKPNVDTEAYTTKKDIRIQFPKYTEFFPNGLDIYFTGNTRSTKQRQLVSTLMADIEESVDSPNGKTCRDAINILWDAKQVYDKKVIYFSGDTELETVRNYVKQCQVKFERNLFRFLGGSAKDKYEELKSKKHGPNGVMKFNLSENLNSLIKKKLTSLKEQKENNKIVKNIVENRLRMIVESAKKNKNIDRLSLQFMSELNQLNKQGLVNEDFGENLKNIFGSDLSSMPKTFFENIFDKILTKINMNDSSLKKSLVLMSEKNPIEIVKSFKDCDSMSILIAKSIVEILHNNINSEKNLTGQGLSSVKNLIGQEIKKDEFIQKVKNNIDDLICQEFSNLTSNSESLLSKIKGAKI